MFICQNCKRQSQRGLKMQRRVVETHPRVYPYRAEANRYHEPSKTYPADPGGKGEEIVKELAVCLTCVSALLTGPPRIRRRVGTTSPFHVWNVESF